MGAEPIRLTTAGNEKAVLLLHGFADTPQTLGYLAAHLHALAFDVVAPLLPGHGRTLGIFDASRAEHWLDGARASLDDLRARYAHVSLVGLSLGGALAATLAAEPGALDALVLLAPYLEPSSAARTVARAWPLVSLALPYVDVEDARSIQDPVERERGRAFRMASPRLIAELCRAADRGRRALPQVRAPTLIVQCREDNRVPSDATERALHRLGARTKRLEWRCGCGHILTVDYRHAEVERVVGAWLTRSTTR